MLKMDKIVVKNSKKGKTRLKRGQNEAKWVKKLDICTIEKNFKGVVNWLENDEKAREGVIKVEKSKQGAKRV